AALRSAGTSTWAENSASRGAGARQRAAGLLCCVAVTEPVAASDAVALAAQRLADEVLFPAAAETDAGERVPEPLLHALAEAGLFGLVGPRSGAVPRRVRQPPRDQAGAARGARRGAGLRARRALGAA